MQHYFIDKKIDDKVYFEESDVHHILHVMRFKNKEHVIVVIQNKKYLTSLVIDAEKVYGIIEKEIEDQSKLVSEITLVYGLPKGEKFELVLQKAAELGIHRVVPLFSTHSLIRLDNKEIDKKMIRWNKIVKEACEQCRRSSMMVVEKPIKNKEIASYKGDVNLVAYEELVHQGTKTLYELLTLKSYEKITILVGPEGGFAKEEIKLYEEIGFLKTSLGKRILRSETACIFMMSVLSFLLERME